MASSDACLSSLGNCSQACKTMIPELPEPTRSACQQLLLVERAARGVSGALPDGLATDAMDCDDLVSVLVQAPASQRLAQYNKLVKRGKRLEDLVMNMLKLLSNHPKVDPSVLKELQDAEKSLDHSIAASGKQHSFYNTGGGTMNNAFNGSNNINSGSGSQFSGASFTGSTFNFGKQ